MNDYKQCKQCGKMLPIGKFRKYYGKRKGSYRMCLDCERINSREKYLSKKGKLTADEIEEFEMIHKLWKVQRANGLQPPRTNKQQQIPVVDMIDALIDDYDKTANKHVTNWPEGVDASTATDPLSPATDEAYIPVELQMWREAELTREPEYYQDEIYDMLKEKYRPVIEINQETLMPVYDDTYKYILDEILSRFDAYEDEYDYGEED